MRLVWDLGNETLKFIQMENKSTNVELCTTAQTDANTVLAEVPNPNAQIEHWMKEFTKLSNQFSDAGNKELQEYWKGQVMGMCKVVDLLKIDIDSGYWLRQLP